MIHPIHQISILSFVLLTSASVVPESSTSTKIHLLVDYDTNTRYASISLGTPPQILNVAFDVVNPHFWVVSDKCDARYALCRGSTKYRSEKSSTYNTTGRVVQFIGTNLTNEGYESSDDANIGGITLRAQEFLEASKVNDGVSQWNIFTGVLGLAPGEGSSPRMTTVTQELLKSGQASKFSIHYNPVEGNGFIPSAYYMTADLTFGTSSGKLLPNPIVSVPLSDPNKWQFISGEISVGEHKFCDSTGCKVNLEPESLRMMIPRAKASDFTRAVNGIFSPENDVIYIRESDIPKIPDLNFEIAGKTLSLKISEITLCYPVDEAYCALLFNFNESDEWTLNVLLLSKYDTEYNFADKTISFM